MRSWLHVASDTEHAGVVVFVRKNLIFFLVGLNVLIAIGVGIIYAYATKPPIVVTPVDNRSSATPSPSATTPAPSPTDPPFESIYNIRPDTSNTTHTVSWALIDRGSKIMVGSANWDQPQYVMSTIKPWIAADYFNQHPNPSQGDLNALALMILDSNDDVAYSYFGGQASLDRLIGMCKLTEMVERGWSWSLTEISARDTARMGECIYSGRATNPQWTAWIVDKMRHVRGQGDFGVRELFQDRTTVATKNGWYSWEGKWYINCLAITDKWVIAIEQQWPYSGGGLQYGIDLANPVCKSVANQVLRLNA